MQDNVRSRLAADRDVQDRACDLDLAEFMSGVMPVIIAFFTAMIVTIAFGVFFVLVVVMVVV